jgi:hypothetical protein
MADCEFAIFPGRYGRRHQLNALRVLYRPHLPCLHLDTLNPATPALKVTLHRVGILSPGYDRGLAGENSYRVGLRTSLRGSG